MVDKSGGKAIPTPSKKEETVWIQNPYGVKLGVPRSIAEWRLRRFIGYEICEPEEVPKSKQYPDDPDLTKEGRERRAARRARAEAMAEKKAEAKKIKGDEEEKKEPNVDEAGNASTPEMAMAKKDRGELLNPEEYRLLPWMQLRDYAKLRGLPYGTMKRVDILAELDKSFV